MGSALDITRAIRDGDEARARELTEAFLDTPFDPLMAELYGARSWAELADWESGILPLMAGFLCYHRNRMGTEPKEWYAKRVEYVYRRLKKLDHQDLMRSLLRREQDDRAKRLERLRGELLGAIMVVEGEGYFGRYIEGAVERQIVKDNRLLRDTRKKMEPSWEGGSIDKIVSLLDADGSLPEERTHHSGDSAEGQYLESFAMLERDGGATVTARGSHRQSRRSRTSYVTSLLTLREDLRRSSLSHSSSA